MFHTSARQDAECQLQELVNIRLAGNGGQPKTKARHLFKEALYRTQLFNRDLNKSWGRIPPSDTALPTTHTHTRSCSNAGARSAHSMTRAMSRSIDHDTLSYRPTSGTINVV